MVLEKGLSLPLQADRYSGSGGGGGGCVWGAEGQTGRESKLVKIRINTLMNLQIINFYLIQMITIEVKSALAIGKRGLLAFLSPHPLFVSPGLCEVYIISRYRDRHLLPNQQTLFRSGKCLTIT